MSDDSQTQFPETSSPAACPHDCVKRRVVFWLLVGTQFLIAATMVLLLESAFQKPWTAILALSGIAVGLSAILSMNRDTLSISPRLRDMAVLVVSGPYRFVRHPMYTALLMFCGAYAISDCSISGLLLWLALFFILVIKIAYEEAMLKRRFPEYDRYAANVKRLVPFLL